MGRLNAPDGSAFVKGLCGDSMEMYLVIEQHSIVDARFFTDGCEASRRCGSAAASMACGKSIREVLALSPGGVLQAAVNIDEQHIHCAILAITTLHKAVADYLLRLHWG
jgi:nitrogen fixation NifU-like protein